MDASLRCLMIGLLVVGGNFKSAGSDNRGRHRTGLGRDPACPRGQCPRRDNTTIGSLSPQKMGNVVNFEDLANRFVINKKEFLDQLDIAMNDFGLKNRFGNGNKPIRALPPSCSPQSSLVPLTPEADGLQVGDILIPPCIRVNRCSGCCADGRFQCEATSSDVHQYLVAVMQLNNYYQNYIFKRWLKINVDTHLSCQCDCRTKEQACSARQYYLPQQCRCVCAEGGRRAACEGADMRWDERSCSCACPDVAECSTGTFFDHVACRCKRPSH